MEVLSTNPTFSQFVQAQTAVKLILLFMMPYATGALHAAKPPQLAEEYKILNRTIVGSRNMFHKLAGEVLVKIKEGKRLIPNWKQKGWAQRF